MSSPFNIRTTLSTPPPKAQVNDPAPLRHPAFDGTSHALIAVAVLVPILFIFLLCLITYCGYRYKKRRLQGSAANLSMTPMDQKNGTVSTLSYNPGIKEDLPPSYDLRSETKKGAQFTSMHNNISGQVDLSPAKNNHALAPSAPSAIYSGYLDQTKRQKAYM